MCLTHFALSNIKSDQIKVDIQHEIQMLSQLFSVYGWR